MCFEEYQQQVLESDLLVVIFYLYNLRMAGIAIANLFVCRIFCLATHITGNYFRNSLEVLKNSFCAPETASAECCLLHFFYCVSLD